MAQGFETRQGPKDPLAPQRGQRNAPQNIPGIGVSAPKAPNFNEMDNGAARAFGKLLDSAGQEFANFNRKKIDEYRLQGEMAYAEGKTEEEIAKSGNRHTVQGFQAMQAKTMYNTWYQTALSDIEQGDQQLPSAEYQKKLSQGYKSISDALSTKDPYVRNLMSAMATESFPKLVSSQIKANNAWREAETYNSFKAMAVSDSQIDPNNPDQLPQVAESFLQNPGLSEERFRSAQVEAAGAALAAGNPMLFEALGFGERDKVKALADGSTLPPDLLSAVIQVESAGNRDAVSSKGAKSEMQVMDATNKDPGYGVRPAQDDSLEERARVGRDYLSAMLREFPRQELALMAYNAGPGTVQDYMNSLGERAETMSTEALVAGFPYKETRDYVRKIMSRVDSPASRPEAEASTVLAMSKQGFTSAQIKHLTRAYDAYQKQATEKYNKDRILTENTLYETARADGNLDQALTRIEDVMQERGYSDGWANKQAARAQKAVEEHAKEYEKTYGLRLAVATNSVASLEPAQQKKAIELYRTSAAGELSARGYDMQTEEGQTQLKEEMVNFIGQNAVVDSAWGKEMSANLLRPQLSKDGRVPPSTMQAYMDFLGIANGTTRALAYKHLTPEAKDFVALVMSYDEELNTEQAMQAAITQMNFEQSDTYTPPKTAPQKVISEGVNKVVDELEPGVLSGIFSRQEAVGPWVIRDEELEAAKKDARLRARIEARTVRALSRDTRRVLTPEAAMKKATLQELETIEFLPGGNVAFGTSDRSIRQAHGMQNVTSANAMYDTWAAYAAHNGVKRFGLQYNAATEDTDAQWADYKRANPEAGDKQLPSPLGTVGLVLTEGLGAPQEKFVRGALEGVVGGVGSIWDRLTNAHVPRQTYIHWDSENEWWEWDLLDDEGNRMGLTQFVPAEEIKRFRTENGLDRSPETSIAGAALRDAARVIQPIGRLREEAKKAVGTLAEAQLLN